MAGEDKTGITNALLEYLLSRGAKPEVVIDPTMVAPMMGEFRTGVNLPPAGQLAMHPQAGADTKAHELAHAAERQMTDQYFENIMSGRFSSKTLDKLLGRNTEKYMFQEAYEKLRLNEATLESLKNLGSSKWWDRNKNYRGSPEEVPAFGVGEATKEGPKNRLPYIPLHLDPTAATEFLILLDLAQRQIKGPGESKDKDKTK